MNVALQRRVMSLDEFLAWDDKQEGRWEFDGYEPQAMVGGTVAHNRIVGAVVIALSQQLKNPCRVYHEGMRLPLAHTIRHPDLMVACTSVANDATEITDPIVVFEVLSTSTLKTDRIAKNREYEAAPSIRRYILLEQDAIAAEVYTRDGGRWVRSTLTSDDLLAMPEISVEMKLADAYAGLELGTQPA